MRQRTLGECTRIDSLAQVARLSADQQPDWSSCQLAFRRWAKGNDGLMRPKRPRIELKTSMTSTLTNRLGSAASASAAFEPETPTAMPQSRLHVPIVRPPQKSE